MTPKSGGGWQAIRYTMKKAREVGTVPLFKALSTRNACKTCALGMGGQLGGMRNEHGHFPEFCKKSLQAMASDMQGQISLEFFEKFSIKDLRTFSPRELEVCGRIVQPLIARPGDTHFCPISWDEALGIAGQKLKQTSPERCFFYASGRSSNEAGFLLNLLARGKGTNNISNCSFFCHQASGVGLKASLGTGTSTVNLDDLDFCDLFFLIGGNPASNHPRLMTKLAEIRERGGQVVVINPMVEPGLKKFRVPSRALGLLFGQEIATCYLRNKIGSDQYVLLAIIKWLEENNGLDHEFITLHAIGASEALSFCRSTTWSKIEEFTGLSRHEIAEVAQIYSESQQAIFGWTMGVTHHEHGTANVRWIVNTALARGMVGRAGAGLMPIRGHSNVQGMGTIGITPQVCPEINSWLEKYDLKPSIQQGLDTMASLECAENGGIDFGLCLGGNLYGASPHSQWTHGAISKIDTLVYLSTTLNTGHAWGHGKTTLILPVFARDEDPQSTTQESMFSFVRVSDGGLARHVGPLSETEVLSQIAVHGIQDQGTFDWNTLRDHKTIRTLIAQFVEEMAGLEGVNSSKAEFEIPGRILHTPKFRTADGLAKFSNEIYTPTIPAGPNQYLMMTIRSEGQFNTVVYEEEDLYRGQMRRDIVLMNPKDIMSRGWKEDDWVMVKSSNGEFGPVLVREFDIALGCVALYCPEANVLVPNRVDPSSRTPAYKSVVVEINAVKA